MNHGPQSRPPATARAGGRVDALQQRYHLTAAEAAVAALIADAHSVKEISTRLAIRDATVRVHLRHIYAKTGVHRQAALVRLVLEKGSQ